MAGLRREHGAPHAGAERRRDHAAPRRACNLAGGRRGRAPASLRAVTRIGAGTN
jgi:hypothetical protein